MLSWFAVFTKPRAEAVAEEPLARQGYDCLYPRMAALIAAPMLLTTEFDHSYSFPLHAPDLPLTLLLVLGFVATRLMIGRALGDPTRVELDL